MAKTTIERRINLFENGQESFPAIIDRTFSDSYAAGYNKLTVTASATDETLAIADLGTLKELELRVHPDDVSKITVKYNGGSTAYAVSPIEMVAEPVTITGSNSSTAAVNVFWRAIYE
jgi:hypothetical protein